MIKNAFIFMDVDGTLVVDGSSKIDSERRKMVEELIANGQEVVILSNKKNHERNAEVATSLGVTYLKTELKKPNPALLDLVEDGVKPLEVYGDKWWTDGRFAKNIGAHFVKVKRLRGPGESFGIKLSYLLDDIFARMFV
jgi:predicted HAD superfamily phosphohydrolase YqeG